MGGDYRPLIIQPGESMSKQQSDNFRVLLDWLDKCPISYTISSMSGDSIHIKCFNPPHNTLEKKDDRYFTINDKLEKVYD